MGRPHENCRLGRRLRVLLAEDAPDNRRYIQHLLRRADVDLVWVVDGKAAIERAGEGFDVILMDMQMPVMDGYEATRALRAVGNTVPIVALTAHEGAEHEDACVEAGCTRFLTKPVSRTKLLDMLYELGPADAGAGPGDDDFFDDPEFLAIVSEFVGELGDRLSELEASLELGDWAQLERLAHRLKGAAGGFGLGDVSRLSAELEGLAKSTRDAEACATTLARLSGSVAGLENDAG